jgi:predicted RNA-binding protein with TRAM domain
MPLFLVMMLGLYSENGWGQLAQFSFPASNSLVVSSNAANITVGNISLSSGTIETNITTGTYFPNEPYIEETGGWTSNTQSSAKSFDFTISADNGYVFSITNIYFRAYSTSAGPSAFGFRIGSTDIYSVNAPNASILVVDQAVSNQTSLSTATIKIQGWLNGSRTSTGGGVFRLDDIIITGTVTAASTAPAAPTITSITPGNQQLSVAFTAGSDGGSAITNYKYSTDGGTSWQTRSTGTTTSPLVISTLSTDGTTPLTNGTSYDVQIRAVNAVGDGIATASTAATPRTTPSAPTITSITPGNQQLSVTFTAGSDGGSAITTYKYSTDGGLNWQTRSSGTTASPLVISTLSTDGTTALTNGTSYNVQIRAVNTVGDGTATSSTAATPRTTPSAPTITSITPGNQQLSVAFTAGSDGGSAITTYKYSTDGGLNWQTRASATTASPLLISTLSTDGTTALTNGASYDIQIRAVNAAGDGTATATTQGTPAVPSSPTITGAATAIAFTTTYGTVSASQSFSVSGAALTADITATAPTGFEVSSDNSTYGSTATFIQSGGSASGTLYVRLAATAIVSGSYNSQNIALTSTGASTVNIITSSSGNTVTAKGLTITGISISNKIYDGNTTATISGTAAYSGLVNSESFSVTGTPSATFSDKNVANGKTVTVVGYTAPSSNYSVTQPTGLTANITAKTLTVTSAAVTSKSYDGTNTATITGSLSGVVSGDVVTLNGTGTFASVNVGTGINVTSTSTLSGADAGNYSLTQPTGLTGDITGASQTITFNALTPVTTSTADYSPGATASSGLTVSYSSSNSCVATIVGGNIHIVGAGTTTITASQIGGGNYSAASSVNQTLVVMNPTSTLAAGDVAIVGINSANPDMFSMVFLKDVSANTAINFTDNGFTASTTTRTGEGFLTYTVPSGGHAAGTVVTWTNGMNISGTGWSTNNPSNMAFNGSGDQLFIFTGSTANWSTLSGITLLYGLNYGTVLSSTSGAANTVQPSTSLLPSSSWLNLGSATYANTYFANGITSTSSVSISGTSATLLSYFVDGTNKWFGNTSTAATFPTFSISVSTSPTINSSGTLSAVNTTYGTASASPTSYSVSANQLTTNLTISAPSGFEISTSIGSGYNTTLTITPDACGTISTTTIYVRLAATTVPGNYSGNILMSSTGAINVNVATVSSTVSVKQLTITGLSADNKIYDGLTTATTSGTASLLGIIGSDNVTLSGTPIFTFSTATVGTGKIVSTSGYTLSGFQASYYSLTQPSFTANISAKELTISSAVANNKTYDGTTSAIITGTLSGVISPDVVTLNLSGTFTSANAGTGISVTSTSSLSGANSGNYTLTQPTGIVADINPKSLIITANDVSKPPGLLLSGGSGSTAFTTSGLIGSETIGTVTITYASAGATTGDGITTGVYPNQVTPSSATGGTFSIFNYSINYVAGTINVVGEYQTRQSGNWGTLSTWEKWNGSSWVACTNSNEIPDYSTVNVTIKNGHIIDNDGSDSPPWDVNNLIVEIGGKLWDNQFGGINSYLQVYGNITCDGTIGDSNGDDISFDIVGGNNCTISGNGTFTAARIRKDANINSTTDATLTINMDIRLTWSSASGAVIYNDGTESNFNVIVNNGKTVRCSGPGSSLANVSIDGNNNTSPDNSNSGGTLTVNGTLDIDGVLYSYTNNTTAGRSCNIIINNGGIIKCRYIKTGVSGSSGNLLRIMSGGKLNIFGSVDTITATLNDITWNNFSTTNNTWDFQDGSTIEYSGETQQQINGITSCSNFIVSGGGLKKLGNDFTVNKMLTLTNGKIQTDSYKLIHTSTLSTDLTHSSGSSSFINGNYRRYITSNINSYELPMGFSNNSNGYHPANFLNGSLTGVTYLDVSVNSISETNDNVDARILTSQEGVAVVDIINSAEWNITPNTSPTSGNYGVDLFVTNMSLTATDDNKFVVVKRPDNSIDYADWNTFESTTFIPISNDPGRIYNSGNGFARRTNYNSFSKFAIGKLNNTVLPIYVYDFKVSKQLENNLVEWKSRDEENLLQYELEKSKDGINYYYLDEVNPIESNYFNEKQYLYADTLSDDLTIYYKLYSRDINGKRNYHGLTFSLNEKLEDDISINYQSTKINIEINNPENINEITIFNALGQLIKRINKQEINNNLITIEFSEFNYGIYLLNINTKYKSVNKKLIIGNN